MSRTRRWSWPGSRSGTGVGSRWRPRRRAVLAATKIPRETAHAGLMTPSAHTANTFGSSVAFTATSGRSHGDRTHSSTRTTLRRSALRVYKFISRLLRLHTPLLIIHFFLFSCSCPDIVCCLVPKLTLPVAMFQY